MTAPHPRFDLYDTTLRDGSQQEGLTLSVADKLAVAHLLDELGVTYIEGGWPGAVPRDTEFFARARTELTLRGARLAAFGATRKAGRAVTEDPQVQALLDSAAPTVTLVAKSHIRHVTGALRTTGEENLAMVRETVAHLVAHGREVFVDAEHFFDGFRADPAYATSVVVAASAAGAEAVVLCDTNGGMLPHDVAEIVADLRARLDATGTTVRLGAHTHDDSGCAVANALTAVRGGITHVQGCVNGYGERTGNADLVTMLADLQLKMGIELVDPATLAESTRIAHAIGEIVNMPAAARAPYVGASAFAHKAGLHASAIRVDPDLYQHIDPRAVGNDMRMIISDMAGRASIELKGRELGFDLADSPEVLGRLAERVKAREAEGYSYEAADASFELLLLEELGRAPRYFDVEAWRASSQLLRDGTLESEATVRITGPDGAETEGRSVSIAEGNGPVNALDLALRSGLRERYPLIDDFELLDFKVRILDAHRGTDATTRVLVRTAAPGREFHTVGVGPNVIEASWEAIAAAFTYGLYAAGAEPA